MIADLLGHEASIDLVERILTYWSRLTLTYFSKAFYVFFGGVLNRIKDDVIETFPAP